MTIDPVLASIIGTALSIMILLLGYFLNRTLRIQDERNKEQSQINKDLHDMVENLNSTLIQILEGNKWMKESCADRHQIINNRLKLHGEEIDLLKRKL